MPVFKVQCDYSRISKKKFFNDKEPKDYHAFLVVNPEIIPDEYVCVFPKRNNACWIWILDDLIKEAEINFGEPLRATKDYKFIIDLGGKKSAKFKTNNLNQMVLKTKDYWENTVKKIGFWESENYFYEVSEDKKKPTKKSNNNPVLSEKKNDWVKITFICLPIVIFGLLLLLIIKWVSKKPKRIK